MGGFNQYYTRLHGKNYWPTGVYPSPILPHSFLLSSYPSLSFAPSSCPLVFSLPFTSMLVSPSFIQFPCLFYLPLHLTYPLTPSILAPTLSPSYPASFRNPQDESSTGGPLPSAGLISKLFGFCFIYFTRLFTLSVSVFE